MTRPMRDAARPRFTLRRPLAAVWLTLLWLLLWGDWSWANVLSGAVVGVVVVLATSKALVSRYQTVDQPRIDVIASVRFVLVVLYKLVQANLYLAYEIITPKNRINTGIIAVPLRTESTLAMLAVADVVTLTPGTVVVDVATDPTVLYVHVLHLHDLEVVRRSLIELEDLFVRAFGTERDRSRVLDIEGAS